MSVIRFPAPTRPLVGWPCARGMGGAHAPCRDIDDLPDDLRDRVLATREIVCAVDRDPPPPAA